MPALGFHGYTFSPQTSEMCLSLNIGLKDGKRVVYLEQNRANVIILSAFILSFLSVSNLQSAKRNTTLFTY